MSARDSFFEVEVAYLKREVLRNVTAQDAKEARAKAEQIVRGWNSVTAAQAVGVRDQGGRAAK